MIYLTYNRLEMRAEDAEKVERRRISVSEAVC